MKKTLLTVIAIFFAFTVGAQSGIINTHTATYSDDAEVDEGPSTNMAVSTVTDALHYFRNKHNYINTTVGNANTSFFVINSPYPVASLNITHAGSIFMNTGTVTVLGLEGLVMRDPNSLSLSIPVKLYLHDLTPGNLPAMPPIDSVVANVSGTGGSWVGANFTTPRTVTANFAVSFKSGATNQNDSISLYLNNAYTPTASGAVPKYGESFGAIRYGNPAIWVSNTNVFGTGTDHEFLVAPRVAVQYQAGVTVPNPTICTFSSAQFINTTTQMSILENRQFNFNKFAAYWASMTNTQMPVTDSIYMWTFTGAVPATSTQKQPTIFFNSPGNQTASLNSKYWYSINIGKGKTPNSDVANANIYSDNSTAPVLSVTGATNICAGQSTTLSVSGNPTFTWTNPQSNSSSIVVSPSGLTTYTVSANNGGCTAVKVITVQVSPAPTVQVAGDNSACLGKAFVISASGAQSYLWANNSSSAPSQTLSSMSAGVIDYTVSGTNGACPTSTAVKSVTIHALPSLTLSAKCKSVCTKASGGTSITLTGMPAGGAYSGTGGAGTVVGPVFTPNTAGTMLLNYSYTDAGTTCSNNTTLSLVVVNCAQGVNVCAVGLKEDWQNSIAVFPNPVLNGQVHLKNIEGVSALCVINILGEQIHREAVSGASHLLDLSGFPAGQYFVRLFSNSGESLTVKIVNQH